MAKYSWNDYCGTAEPYSLPLTKVKKGESKAAAYGLNPSLVRELTEGYGAVDVFEFGRSHGIYLIVEANSADQAGFLLRKFIKDAILLKLGLVDIDGRNVETEELDLGVD